MAITRKQLAESKGLDEEVLKSAGVFEKNNSLSIPYFDSSKNIVRVRIRHGYNGCDSRWEKSSIPIIPYGVWVISTFTKKGFLVIVEGESDCWTLWSNGIPALGIPGSTMSKVIELEHVEPFPVLYIWQEWDDAGFNFVKDCINRLHDIGYKGDIKVIESFNADAKDPNDLFRKNPGTFKDTMSDLMENSETSHAWDLKSWGEPIPIQNSYPDLLPVDVFPSWVKKYLVSLAEFTQTPTDMGIMLFFSAMSTALANKAVILVRTGYTEPLIIEDVLKLSQIESGSCLKTNGYARFLGRG